VLIAGAVCVAITIGYVATILGPPANRFAAVFIAALVGVDYFGKKLGNASEQPAAMRRHAASGHRWVLVCVDQRRIWSRLMFITRRVFTTVLSLTGLSVLAGFSPLRRIVRGMAQSVSDVDKPVSLPEMALGPASAFVTIIEYASMTCSHCAAFNANVFPKIKSEYIDTEKVRYVFREFPLDIKAAVASMLARCIAESDAGKYFAVIDTLFKTRDE
jgi:hypothetical protein